MEWVVETVLPDGAFVCRLKADQAVEATLTFETPRRSKVSMGGLEYVILDKDGFFHRDVRLMGPDGALLISASVGWSGRMWWKLLDDSKVFWDFSADWDNHRVVLKGEQELLRLVPIRSGKKLASCEVRAAAPDPLLALFGFYLLVYDERESLESAHQWQDLMKGAAAITLAGAVDSLFELD